MGQLDLPDSAKIYIDTVIVIYTIEVNPNYGCSQFLTNDQRLRAVPGLPILILDEVLAS